MMTGSDSLELNWTKFISDYPELAHHRISKKKKEKITFRYLSYL
jgi:uncharacterized protein YydD (DUF2326 family)